jgi:hypothetical protein
VSPTFAGCQVKAARLKRIGPPGIEARRPFLFSRVALMRCECCFAPKPLISLWAVHCEKLEVSERFARSVNALCRHADELGSPLVRVRAAGPSIGKVLRRLRKWPSALCGYRMPQEGAPVPDANAMNRCMYSVALVGTHNPCWIDCLKALSIFLCSIFWNIST